MSNLWVRFNAALRIIRGRTVIYGVSFEWQSDGNTIVAMPMEGGDGTYAIIDSHIDGNNVPGRIPVLAFADHSGGYLEFPNSLLHSDILQELRDRGNTIDDPPTL